MSGEHERAVVRRAGELAEDAADIAGAVITLIGRARKARVDQAALSGPVTAVRLLDENAAFRLMAACRGRVTAAPYARDGDLLAHGEDIEAELDDLARTALALTAAAEAAAGRARRDADKAVRDLAAAQALPVSGECDGCHDRRAAAVDAARRDLRDAKDRCKCCTDATRMLRDLRFREALAAMRRLPEDLAGTYEPAYDLVRADPQALPRDGDFLTGLGGG